jgi:hypothetical protein
MYAAELTNRSAGTQKPGGSSSEVQMNRVKRSVLAYLSKSDLNKTKTIQLEDFFFHLRSLGMELNEASIEALRRGSDQVDYEMALGEMRYDVNSGKWFIPLDKHEAPAMPSSHARFTYLSNENSFLRDVDEVPEDPVFDDILGRMEDKFQRL